MEKKRSIFIISALLGVVFASAIWLYRFYAVVPVGPGNERAQELGFTSSKRYSEISGLTRSATPRQDFSNSQFAVVEDVLSSPNDSVRAKLLATVSLMTIRSSAQRERAVELMSRYTGKDKVLDNTYLSIMKTYSLEGSRSIVEKAANSSSPISILAKQAIINADQQQAGIDTSRKKAK